MKKILVLLMALGLFIAACNNNKTGKDQKANNREKDDYGKSDNTNNKDEKMTDGNAVKTDDGNDNNATMSGWPQSERTAFITNCVTNAMQGGTITRTIAQNYCDCMLNKMETLYPDIQDAGKITVEELNSPAMEKMAKDCLKIDN
jgi:hypothetical protein